MRCQCQNHILWSAFIRSPSRLRPLLGRSSAQTFFARRRQRRYEVTSDTVSPDASSRPAATITTASSDSPESSSLGSPRVGLGSSPGSSGGESSCEIVGVRLDQAGNGDRDRAVALNEPFRVDDRDADDLAAFI